VHLGRAATGLAQVALVGQADVDPELDGAGQVAPHEVGLVLGGQAAAERQCVVRVEREREQPDHHALVGLRRMARERQRVVAVVAAIDVGDREVRLEDSRLEGHGSSIPVSRRVVLMGKAPGGCVPVRRSAEASARSGRHKRVIAAMRRTCVASPSGIRSAFQLANRQIH
jgi:hypothetical protein